MEYSYLNLFYIKKDLNTYTYLLLIKMIKSFVIPKEINQMLLQKASKQDRSESSIVRIALKNYFREETNNIKKPFWRRKD